MKIKNKKTLINRKKTAIIVIFALIILLAVAVSAFFVLHKSTNSVIDTTKSNSDVNKVNYESATSDQIKSGSSTKEDNATSNTDGQTANDNAKAASHVTITVAQENAAKTAVQIRSYIDVLDSTATCTLTLTKESATVSRTASVQVSANVTTCMGFDVNVSDLSPGTWSATVAYLGNTASGSATTTVSVQ